MKLPECPHCGRLLVGKMTMAVEMESAITVMVMSWFCPETLKRQEPVWREVKAE